MSPARPLLLGFATASALVLLRLADTPLIPMAGGWEYAAPTYRLLVALRLDEVGLLGALGDFGALDRDFPPGMHLISALLRPLTGDSLWAVTAANLGWMVLLGAAVTATARRLGSSPEAAARAGALTVLLPAVHGAATRYYYDLPMVALLWLGFALALGERGPGWRRMLGAGAAFATAAVVKWTAIPLAGITLVCAAGAHGRWRECLGAAVVAVVLVAGLYGFDFEGSSLDRMASLMAGGERPPTEAPATGGIGALLGAAKLVGGLHPARLAWYPLAVVASCTSAALALALARPALRGLGGRPGRVLGLLVGGQIAFLLIFVPVLDARFALSWLPVLAIAAARGWERSARPRFLDAAVLGLAVLVGADLHAGTGGPWAAPWTLELGGDTPPIPGRGLSATGTFEGLGWSRADEQDRSYAPEREALWAAIGAAGGTAVGFEATVALVSEHGDEPFLRWASLRDRLAGGSPPLLVAIPPGRLSDVDRVLVPEGSIPTPGFSEVATVAGCSLRAK